MKKKSVEERFWAKVDKSNGSDGCWHWTGYVNPRNGYGYFNFSPKHRGSIPVPAHRACWKIVKGEILEVSGDRTFHGTCVLHKCDNRKCVNPCHLFLGSHEDNVRDAKAKNRLKCPKPRFGLKNNKGKLSDLDVREIRAMRLLGKKLGEIAEMFGVTKTTVDDVTKRKTHKNLP